MSGTGNGSGSWTLTPDTDNPENYTITVKDASTTTTSLSSTTVTAEIVIKYTKDPDSSGKHYTGTTTMLTCKGTCEGDIGTPVALEDVVAALDDQNLGQIKYVQKQSIPGGTATTNATLNLLNYGNIYTVSPDDSSVAVVDTAALAVIKEGMTLINQQMIKKSRA